MELRQETELQQKISQNTIQAVSILQMGNQELEEYLETMALENPVIETEEKSMITDIGQDGERKIPRKSYEDYQNRAYRDEGAEKEDFRGEEDRISLEDAFLPAQEPSERAASGTVLLGQARQEAVEALTALGYSASEALRAVKAVEQEDMDVEDLLKAALKKMYG